jgi:hypothetical protein
MNSAATPLASLRRFLRPRPARERCELCDAELPADHSHRVEPAERRLLCACEACALLFSNQGGAKYRRVPRRVESLADFCLADETWEGLHLPINLAFFLHSTPAGRVVAVYPSPAGATESLLPLEAWQALVEANPFLRELEPDVEALLVNRVGEAAAAAPTPIHGIVLRCQVRIEPARRHYTAAEKERLLDLFGTPERWGQTLRPLLGTPE